MGKRYLLWFCTAFVATAILGPLCKNALCLIILVEIITAITALTLCCTKNRRSAALVVAAVGISLVWQTVFFRLDKAPKELSGKIENVECEVCSYSRRTDSDNNTFTAYVEYGNKRYTLIVCTLDKTELSPGDKIKIDAKFSEFEDTKAFREKTYYKSHRIDLRGYATKIEVVEKSEKIKAVYIPQYLARQFEASMQKVCKEDTCGFLNALILGDKSSLSKDFIKSLRATGLSHTVSVSGMHISFLVGLLLFFSKKKRTRILAIPVIILFAAMVGAPQSALRAVIMQSFLIIASLTKREYDPLTALAFSAFLLVAVNPYCATDVSFLLSFSSTLGIIVLHPQIRNGLNRFMPKRKSYFKKLVSDMYAMVAVSMSSRLFTVPISVCSFGSVSMIGIFANVIFSFIISFIFVAVILNTIFTFVFMPVGKFGGIVLDIVVGFVMSAIKEMALLPFAQVFTENLLLVFLICFICFAVAYAISVTHRKIRIPVLLCAIAVCSASVALGNMLISEKSPMGQGVRFDVLDVGQGQCVVASTEDSCVVIDCGGDDAANKAISHLVSIGAENIDALILTHAHDDHANGAEHLVESVKTKSIYMPDTDRENAAFIKLTKKTGKNCKPIFVERDTTLEFDGMKVKLLTLPQGSDENENGLVVLVCDDDYETLITGDIATKNEKLVTNRLPDCESYIVGHHGSKSSSSQALLNKALPEFAVISVGVGNAYGHPSKEVLLRLEHIGARVERTDITGTITFFSRESVGEAA